MNSSALIKKFRESRRAQAIFCVAGLAVSAVILLSTSGRSLGSFFPSRSKIEAAKKELDKAAAELAIQEARQHEVQALEKSYKEMLGSVWENERDGDPELELRKKIEEAAKKYDFKLNSIGALRRNRINNELSFYEVDVAATETIELISLFLKEVQEISPRMYWKRADLNPENLFNSDRVRLSGTIRLIGHEAAAGKTREVAGAKR